MWGGIQKVSLPMDMCQAKSQIPPIAIQLMPATEDQIVQGITLASAMFATEARFCWDSITGTASATDIRQLHFWMRFVGIHQRCNKKSIHFEAQFILAEVGESVVSVGIFVAFFTEDDLLSCLKRLVRED